jgi:hypothetical protein
MVFSQVSDAIYVDKSGKDMLVNLDKIAKKMIKFQESDTSPSKKIIFKVAVCTAEFANIIEMFNAFENSTRPLLSKSTIKNLDQKRKEMNGLKTRHLTSLSVIAGCTAYLSNTVKDFVLQHTTIFKKLDKIIEDMENLKNLEELENWKDKPSRVSAKDLKQVTSNIMELTHIMEELVKERSQIEKYLEKYRGRELNSDKRYQMHKEAARRINSCDRSDYAEFFELKGRYENDTHLRHAVDKAFVTFSNLFDPHNAAGNNYYQGAQQAHNRKSQSCSLFQSADAFIKYRNMARSHVLWS